MLKRLLIGTLLGFAVSMTSYTDYIDQSPTPAEIAKIKMALRSLNDDRNYEMVVSFIKYYKNDKVAHTLVISMLDELDEAVQVLRTRVLVGSLIGFSGTLLLGCHKQVLGLLLVFSGISMATSMNVFSIFSDFRLHVDRLAKVRDLCYQKILADE